MPIIGAKAFGGAPLSGDRLVRVVYLDESGHSSNEDAAIVSGVILDPDKQWLLLTNEIEALKHKVPEQFRDNFVFHATDLESGGKYRRDWSDEERWTLLNELLALPRKLNIPLVAGFFTSGLTEMAIHFGSLKLCTR
ncbi:hypothetical protein [Methylocystis suflitae]|uniref:hypothetical protein n=1 Tax=Methylocystis suflitae TaxID=2951405 RepID=UPI00210D138C|nr:hypothetical protein [Methylocystis suflitae]MCQ4188880.1 hypothetical protein [Methylocystis suflitae]